MNIHLRLVGIILLFLSCQLSAVAQWNREYGGIGTNLSSKYCDNGQIYAYKERDSSPLVIGKISADNFRHETLDTIPLLKYMILLGISANGKYLAFASSHNAISVLHITSRQIFELPLRTAFPNVYAASSSVAFDSTEQYLTIASSSSSDTGVVSRWNIEKQVLLDSIRFPIVRIYTDEFVAVSSYPLSPNGNTIVFRNDTTKNIELWNTFPLYKRCEIIAGSKELWWGIFTGDSKTVMVRYNTNKKTYAQGYDVMTGKESAGLPPVVLDFPWLPRLLYSSYHGDYLVAVGSHDEIYTWSAAKGWRLLPTSALYLSQMDGMSTYLSISPDGQYIRTIAAHGSGCSSGDNMGNIGIHIAVLSTENGKPVFSVPENAEGLNKALLSVDGSKAAYSTVWGRVSVVENPTGKTICSLPERARIVGFMPSGELLVKASATRLYNSATAELIRTIPIDTALIPNGIISPDGSLLAAWTSDTIRLFDMNDGRKKAEIPVDGGIGMVRFDLAGSRLFFSHAGISLSSWNIGTSDIGSTITFTDSVGIITSFSQDGKIVTTFRSVSNLQPIVRVWDMDSKEATVIPFSSFDYSSYPLVTYDGRFIAGGETYSSPIPPESSSAWIWDTRQKKKTYIHNYGSYLSGCGYVVTSISNNGTYIAIRASNGIAVATDSILTTLVAEPNEQRAKISITPLPIEHVAKVTIPFISGGNFKVRIVDILGRIVFQTTNNNVTAGIYEIPIEPDILPTGILYCTIEVLDGTESYATNITFPVSR